MGRWIMKTRFVRKKLVAQYQFEQQKCSKTKRVAGFMAWISSTEPAHVFFLLNNMYQA
jgi:hypothetical protein